MARGAQRLSVDVILLGWRAPHDGLRLALGADGRFDMVRPTLLLTLLLCGCPDPGALPSDDAGADGARGDAALVEGFEVFAEVTPRAPDAVVTSHRNPLPLDLGTVPVGQAVAVTVTYYNLADRAGVTAREVTVLDYDGPSPPSALRLGAVVAPGTVVRGATRAQVAFTFTPSAAGAHRATVRLRTDAGVFDTLLTALGR